MANSFGSLYVGVAGLQSSQQGLNVTANNLANVDTKGYVRQRVLYEDRNYITFNLSAAISKQQSGLGVRIGDVLHTRDVFLDRSYRTEAGRQAFYASTYEAAAEVETHLQEMEGQAFQDAIEDFWKAMQTYSGAPDDSIYQNLVIQKAQLFISRADAVYSGLQSYQYNINTQIEDDVKRINEIGKAINEMNMAVLKIEAGDVETAMTIRDARDQALDELASLVSISYTETSNGIVKVSIEGTEFVDESRYYEMGMKRDKATGFVTPYWPYLSDVNRDKYTNVFNFNIDISTENKNDMGALKALVLARGDHVANYRDVEGMNKEAFNDTTGMSVMMKAEAEFDQLIHKMVTAINDKFCPNISASDSIAALQTPGAKLTVTLEDGTMMEIDGNSKILDAENCATGASGELPPKELFTRLGTKRYTTAKYADAVTGEEKTIYIYNEERAADEDWQYTIKSLRINSELIDLETEMPYLMQNGDVAYGMAADLCKIWEEGKLTLNPNDTRGCTFKEYYRAMVGEQAAVGDVYASAATSLLGTVNAVDNQRQQVIGVSSDEELTYMIKYQNAYNASSRFINVINEMIEHLIMQLG